MGIPGYKSLWTTGQFADNNGICANFKQIPSFKRFEINLNVRESKRYFQYNNFKQKKAGENQYNKELVVCTLYKSHSAVISTPQFKVKATQTFSLDVA